MAVFAASLWFAEEPERLAEYYQRFPETAFFGSGMRTSIWARRGELSLGAVSTLVPSKSLHGQLSGYCSAMLGNLGARVAFVAHPYPILFALALHGNGPSLLVALP